MHFFCVKKKFSHDCCEIIFRCYKKQIITFREIKLKRFFNYLRIVNMYTIGFNQSFFYCDNSETVGNNFDRITLCLVLTTDYVLKKYQIPYSVAYLEGCRWVLSTHRFLDMGAEHPSILSKISLDVGTFKKEILLIRTHYF